jgi:hypothetical protein
MRKILTYRSKRKTLSEYRVENPKLFESTTTLHEHLNGVRFIVVGSITNGANVVANDILEIDKGTTISHTSGDLSNLKNITLGEDRTNSVSLRNLMPEDSDVFESTKKEDLIEYHKELIEEITETEEQLKYLEIAKTDKLHRSMYRAYRVLQAVSDDEIKEIDKDKLNKIAELIN